MLQQWVFVLLVKLAAAAALASILVRFRVFQRVLMQEERTLGQRLQLALGFGVLFGSGVAARVVTGNYSAGDLGLEGSLVAGLLGGYMTGLVGGIVVSLPAMFHGELLTMALCAAVGVLGGLLRDIAPDPEEVWRFAPFPDFGLARLLRHWREHRLVLFQLSFLVTILGAEFVRLNLGRVFEPRLLFTLARDWGGAVSPWGIAALYASTILCVTVPLKVWNNFRTEAKLEAQHRLLIEARMAALTRQINPHFLFNTLNSISTLVRLNPDQARQTILQLSRILRRLLRKHENVNPLREELAFIDDYLAIEMVRFGDKLRFIKEVEPATLDKLVPSMLLQPIVENSVRHGLSGKVDGGIIRVRSRLVDGRLHLLVEDDGVGIPEERLATLFQQGIGVSNVNERLQVLFGANYRMWIDSKPGEGTRTEFEIPDATAPLAAAS